MKIASVLLGVTLLAASARADTLRVPQDFATIQDAVDAAVEGDLVLVSKGTWAGFNVTFKTGITIKGKAKAVVDGTGTSTPLVVIENSTGITLTGLVIANSGDDGIDVSDSDGITISKCRVEGIAETGIAFNGGVGHRIEKTRLTDVGGEAINLGDETTNAVIDKNRMTSTNGAITLGGSGHAVTKNRVEDSGNEGFSVVATNCLFEKNHFDGVEDDALDVEGDDNTFLKNRIKNVNSNGVEVDPASGDPFAVTGNTFEKNKVTGADDHGFFVSTSGNTFTKNKAKGSGNLDLLDVAGQGANVYEGNTFGTQQFQ